MVRGDEFRRFKTMGASFMSSARPPTNLYRTANVPDWTLCGMFGVCSVKIECVRLMLSCVYMCGPAATVQASSIDLSARASMIFVIVGKDIKRHD